MIQSSCVGTKRSEGQHQKHSSKGRIESEESESVKPQPVFEISNHGLHYIRAIETNSNRRSQCVQRICL